MQAILEVIEIFVQLYNCLSRVCIETTCIQKTGYRVKSTYKS